MDAQENGCPMDAQENGCPERMEINKDSREYLKYLINFVLL